MVGVRGLEEFFEVLVMAGVIGVAFEGPDVAVIAADGDFESLEAGWGGAGVEDGFLFVAAEGVEFSVHDPDAEIVALGDGFGDVDLLQYLGVSFEQLKWGREALDVKAIGGE